jgi:PPM family protein phosphatase
LCLGQQVTIAHVGDSRAYGIYPDGRSEVVDPRPFPCQATGRTRSHQPDEVENFPHRNVLYRALGQGEILEADVFTVSFPQTGCLMFCSDGLWGVIADQDLSKIIREAPSLQRACQNLVEAANTAGGPDNISVIIAQMIG